jgi:hypothetical protein
MANYMFDVIEHIRENLPRLEDVFVSDATDTQEAYSDEEIMNHAFWLNDLLFICPPQSINTQTDQLVARYQALRSAASSKVPYGKATKYFMVDLVIPAKSGIMNVDYRLPDNNAVAPISNDSDYVNTGKRGGILDLIIQFKVTPFARVENAFIRSTLGISKDKNMAMCLHQLTLYTIKGRKGAVGCKLLMSVFNYSPYSPNFLYKEDWVTKNQYGRFNIESVNRIDFGDAEVTNRRVPYKIYVQGVEQAFQTLGGEPEESTQTVEVEAENAISPLTQNRARAEGGSNFSDATVDDQSRSLAFQEQYNMLFTDNEDEMSSVDSYFMDAPRAVANPATSAVFKAYIDWVHSQWTSISDLDGQFNGSGISQYGSQEQDLGDQVILEWKEFKTEPMPPDVEQEVKIWYRQRMADYQAARASRSNYSPNTGPAAPTTQPGASANSGQAPIESAPTVTAAGGLEVITNPTHQNWPQQGTNPLEPYKVILDPTTPTERGRFAAWRANRNPPYNHKGIDVSSQSVGKIGYEMRAIYNGNLSYQLSDKEGILTNDIARDIIAFKEVYSLSSSSDIPYVKVSGSERDGNEVWKNGITNVIFAPALFGEYEDRGPAGVFLRRGGRFYPVEGIVGSSYGTEKVYYFTYFTDFAETRGGLIASLKLNGGPYQNTDLDGLTFNYMHIGATQRIKDLIEASAPTAGNRKHTLGQVQAGDLISYGGCTGIYTDPPHLHFEIAKGRWGKEVPITEYLDSTPFVFFNPSQRSDVSAADANDGLDVNQNTNYYPDGLDLNTWTQTQTPGFVPAPTPAAPTTGTTPAQQQTQAQASPLGVDQAELEREQAENYNEEALGSLEKYRQFVERQEAQGWRLFKENTLAFNIFYRVKRISIPASDQENYPLGVPIVCDFISGGASNIIATIPMMGQTYPTAQYLGRRDDEFMLSFRAVGLNNVKLLSRIRDELKSQAHFYKWIPNAWMIKVENKFINAFGHRYFVINNMSEVTSPGQPNTYNIEIGITSHPANTDQGQITSMQVTNKEEIKLTFWEELLYGYAEGEDDTRKLLIQKQVSWKLVYDDLLNGTTIKPFLSEGGDGLDLPLRQRNLFLANPDMLSRTQNTNQPTPGPLDTGNSNGDPNQLLFNFLNVEVASTLNLIRLINHGYLGIQGKYINLVNRIFPAGDASVLNDFLPLGAGNIVAETSLVDENGNRAVVGSSEQSSAIQFANQSSGYTNWFTERQGFHRWSEPEKSWSFGDNVARLEDMRLLDTQMAVTGIAGSVEGVLLGAYNHSLNIHLEYLVNGVYSDGDAVPLMEAYLDVRPSIRALMFGLYGYQGGLGSINFLDANKTGGGRASTMEYFCSLFTRELRAGFLYPVFGSDGLLLGRAASVISGEPNRTLTGHVLQSTVYSRPLPIGRSVSPFFISEPAPRDTLAASPSLPYQPSFGEAVIDRIGIYEISVDIEGKIFSDETELMIDGQIDINYIGNYIWDQLAIPYLNNAFSMEDIIKWSEYVWADGTPMFPRTSELLKRQRIGAEGVAYPDMMLPLHPFWSSQNSTLPVSSIYTEPDFYLVNYGIDTNTESAHLEPVTDPSKPRTADSVTNQFIQIQSELAVQSLDMMEGRARNPDGSLIGELTHTTVDEIQVPKSKAFIEMTNPVNPNALGTFKGDSVYLRSDHSMGSYYASGNVNVDGNRTKDYSDAVRSLALGSGAPNITKTKSADASADTVIGQKINQSPQDTRFTQEALKYFQGPVVEGFSYESTPQGSDVQLNAGMRILQDRESGDPNLILWRNVAPMFAPNAAFPETPLSFGGQSFVGMGFDGYSRNPPSQVIESINNNDDSVNDSVSPYEFNTESSTSDPAAFVNGNWGYSDIHQFTTSRLSTYEKIRDGLKGLNIKKWAFRRAFPTFKVYIIEEDEIEREWVQYDDFYQYNQIQEIQISESRKRPASVCMINFINIGGALDGNNQWHYWARNNPAEEYNSLNAGRARQQAQRDRGLESDTSNSLLAGTAEEQNINRFVLNPGVKIKVKLGYSNNPTKMEDVFLGSIAEIMPDADAGSVVIVAQGYGAELVEKPKGASKEEIATTYFTTFDVLASLMFSSEVKHFGKKKIDSISLIGMDQSLRQNELIYRNTVSQTTSSIVRRCFGAVLRGVLGAVTLGTSELIVATVGLANDLVFEVDRQLRQIRVGPEDGPQDDNIYAPNYSVAQLDYFWWHPQNLYTGRWRQAPPVIPPETRPNELDLEDGANQTGSTAPNNIQEREFSGVPEDQRIADPNFQYFELMSPSELEYNIFYSSIWDIFQEMTLRHPGFVKHPRIYKNSNRMTMFFGLPDQKYWAAEPSVGEITQANATFSAMRNGIRMVPVSGPTVNRRSGNISYQNPQGYATLANGYQTGTSASTGGGGAPGELAVDIDLLSNWMALVQRRLKPFRNWYSINSATDIIENRIEANKLGFYTSVSLQYLSGASANKLKGALRSLEGAGSPDAGLITPSNFIAWSDKEVEHTQAHRDMSPDEIRQKFHQFANCRSRSIARRYARALLAGYAKEMYKGSISMLGNSKVKPYDVLLINDTHHNVQGPIEVEEVIHNFNPMTGFTTEVIPDTFIIQEDRTAFVMYNSFWAQAGLKTSRHMEGILFQRDNTLPDSNAFNIIADRYSRSLEFERANIEALNELVTDLRTGYFSELTGGGALLGVGSGTAAFAYATAGGAAGVIAAGAITLGAAMWFGLMSNLITSVYVNYVHNNRAYFMIPLMRNNSPWTVGYNITGTNSFAMGIFDVIRRWWQDGGEGVTLSNIDAALTEYRIGLSLSNQLNNFSSLSLWWDDYARSFRTGLTLGGSQNIRSGIR